MAAKRPENFENKYFPSEIANISAFAKQKLSSLSHVFNKYISSDETRFITPYYKHRVNLENNTVHDMVNKFNHNLNKDTTIREDLLDFHDIMVPGKKSVEVISNLTEEERLKLEKAKKTLSDKLKMNGVVDVKKEKDIIRKLENKEKTTQRVLPFAPAKIEPTPRVTRPDILKAIQQKEKEYIDSIAKPRMIHTHQVLTPVRQKEISEYARGEMAAIIRQDINNIRDSAGKKFNLPLLGETFDGENNTEAFNKLLSEDPRYAREYLKQFKRSTRAVRRRITQLRRDEFQDVVGREATQDKRFHAFQQIRGAYVDPESIYKNNIYQPTNKRFKSINFKKFGVQTIPKESISYHLKGLTKELEWHKSEGAISDYQILDNVPLGDGNYGRLLKFTVTKNNTNIKQELVLPKNFNNTIKFSRGGTTFNTGLIGVRTAPNAQSLFDAETLFLNNVTSHLPKFIEETSKIGAKPAAKNFKKLARRHIADNISPVEDNISDYIKRGTYISVDTKRALTGRGLRSNAEKNMLAAKSMMNLAKARSNGAWSVVYDIETVADDANIGTQLLAKNPKLGVYNIAVTIYDDKGKAVDFVNLYHDPKNIDIYSDSAMDIMDGLVGPEQGKKIRNVVRTNGISKREISNKINGMIKERLTDKGIPFYMITKNGTGFDNIVLTNFFKGMDGGEFAKRLKNQALNIDYDAVSWFLLGEARGNQLSQTVRLIKGQDEYRAYRKRFGEDFGRLSKKLKKTNMIIKDLGGLEHTSLIDNDLVMQLKPFLEDKSFSLGEAGSLYDAFEQINKQGDIDIREKLSMQKLLTAAPHFLGAPGARHSIMLALTRGALSPNKSVKGYGSQFDVSKFTPYGIHNAQYRQLYQAWNGQTFSTKKWDKKSRKAYKDKYGFSPWNPVFSTDFAEGLVETMNYQSWQKHGIKREFAPVMNVFFPIIKNAQTLEESFEVSKSITKMFTKESTRSFKFDFEMPMTANNLKTGIFHKQIFDFMKTKDKLVEDIQIEYPNLDLPQVKKLAAIRARNKMNYRKIKTNEQFIRTNIRANGKTRHFNETGFDLDILDVNLTTDAHQIDPQNVDEFTGIIVDTQYSEGIKVGDKAAIPGTSNKGTMGNIVEDMFSKKDKIFIGTKAGEAKFFKRGEFGGMFQILVGNAIWHVQHRNKNANIKDLSIKLNSIFERYGMTQRISDVGELLNKALMSGPPDLKMLSDIYKTIGLTYSRGEAESIKRILGLNSDIGIKRNINELDEIAKRISRNINLRHTQFDTTHEAYTYLSGMMREIPEQIREGGAKFLWQTEDNSVGFMGMGLRVSLEDNMKSMPQIGKHDIRRSAIEKVRMKLFSGERNDTLDKLFLRTTGGENKKHLKTLIDIDFTVRNFLNLEDKSKFVSTNITELNKKQVSSLVRKFQENTFLGHNIDDIKQEIVEKEYFGGQKLSIKQFTDFKDQLKKSVSANKTIKDLQDTFFDLTQGEIFEIDLGKDIDINVSEALDKALGRGFVEPELAQQWKKFAREQGIKDKLTIKQKQYIVNPARLLEEVSDNQIFNFSSNQLQFMNFATRLMGNYEGQKNSDELALELLKLKLYSFNSEMNKKNLLGKATESVVKGAQARIINQYANEAVSKYVQKGGVPFYYNFMGVTKFEKIREFLPKDVNRLLDQTFKEYRKSVKGNVKMTDWLLQEFGMGAEKRAMPISTAAYPVEMNVPMMDMLYQLFDDRDKGLRANDLVIETNPLLVALDQRDFDGDRMGFSQNLYKSWKEWDQRTTEIMDRYIEKNSDGSITIRPEYRKVVDDINSKRIRIGRDNKQLIIDQQGNTRVRALDPNDIDMLFTDTIEDPRIFKSLGWNKLLEDGQLEFIKEQQNSALLQTFSKSQIGTATEKALRAPLNTLYYLARNGDEPTLKNIFDQQSGKFTPRVRELFDDLRFFVQGILDLKSTKGNSSSLIEEKLTDIANLDRLASDQVRQSFMSRGYFENSYDLLKEVMDTHKEIRKNIAFDSQRKLITGKFGGQMFDLINAVTSMGEEGLEGTLGELETLMGHRGAKRTRLPVQMQKGFWEKFKDVHGAEKAAGLSRLGKYAAIGGVAYLGLNFFRPDQMSNKYNPLDLFTDLGPQEGFGGEEFDYFSKNYGIGRFTPLDIPEVEFDGKTRIIMDDPYAEEKRERRSLMFLENLLLSEDEGKVDVNYRRKPNYIYNNKLERIDRITIRDIMSRGGAVFR